MAFLVDGHKVNSYEILEALHKDIKSKYPARLNVAGFTTPQNRRLDLLSLDYMGGNVRGYEIKVDRRDFVQDSKWEEYLAYCHQFYFVCPSGLIKLDELPSGIGLIYADMGYLYEHYPNKDPIKTNQRCIRMNLIRGANVLHEEMPKKKYDYIIRRLIFRAMDLTELVEPARFWQEGYEQKAQRGLLNINGSKPH